MAPGRLLRTLVGLLPAVAGSLVVLGARPGGAPRRLAYLRFRLRPPAPGHRGGCAHGALPRVGTSSAPPILDHDLVEWAETMVRRTWPARRSGASRGARTAASTWPRPWPGGPTSSSSTSRRRGWTPRGGASTCRRSPPSRARRVDRHSHPRHRGGRGHVARRVVASADFGILVRDPHEEHRTLRHRRTGTGRTPGRFDVGRDEEPQIRGPGQRPGSVSARRGGRDAARGGGPRGRRPGSNLRASGGL